MGRHLSPDAIYAKELGVRRRVVTRLGGEIKLRAMDVSARNLLLGDYRPKEKDVPQLLHEMGRELRSLRRQVQRLKGAA